MKSGFTLQKINPHKIKDLCTLSTGLSPKNRLFSHTFLYFPTLSTGHYGKLILTCGQDGEHFVDIYRFMSKFGATAKSKSDLSPLRW